jgi:hypothetical protein
MGTRYLLLLSMLITGAFCSAQHFTWAKQFGIGNTFIAKSIVADHSGNSYFTGTFNGTGDQDPSEGTFTLNSNGSGDIFVGKVNAAGNLVWLKSIGGGFSDNGMGIAVDPAGNVYVGGNFGQTVDFDPGPGTYTINSPVYNSIFQSDAFLLKLDADGDFIWAGSISGERDEYITDLELKGSRIYVTGLFGKVTDFDIQSTGSHTLFASTDRQAFVAAYTLSGQLEWVKMVDGNSEGTALSFDSFDNVYVTGNFMGTADFDPSSATSNLVSAGGQDLFVWKLDFNGNLVWAKGAGGSNHEESHAIVSDASGNVYLTGQFGFVTDLDPGTGTSSFTATPGSDQMDKGTDIFILKLSSEGNYQWAKAMGGLGYDHGDAIALDMSGHVYIGGVFTFTVDFEPNYNDAILSVNNPMDEIFLLKLNTAGDFFWLGQMGGPEHDQLNSIAITSDNTIFLTGTFRGTADLDPTEGTKNIMSAGVVNAFVVKLNGSVHLLWNSLSEQTAHRANLFPNPCIDRLNIESNGEKCLFRLFSMNGGVVAEENFTGNTTIQLGALAPGLYLAEISNAEGVNRQKILVR